MEKTAISVKASKIELNKVKGNALLIGLLKDKLTLSGELKKLDEEYGGIISSYIKNNHFKAEKGETRSVFVNRNIKNLVLVGLGEEEKYNLDVLLNAIADASKKFRDNGTENFSLCLDSFKNKFKEEDVVEKIVLSALIGLYKFTEFKTKDNGKIRQIKQITIITNSNKNFDNEVKYASVVANAVNKTRDLVNMPPNVATPEYMADYAKELAKKSGLKCIVFDEKQIEGMKMGCFINVAKGSINKPRLVILEYYGNDKKQKPIAIVGKGITFDSGGLNLKPYPYILNMKDDKGGAVAAMHIIEACYKLKFPLNLIAIMPFCENMPSGSSFRPDDVLTAHNGMTVEIKNTDAEGRLILADALSYAAEMKPQAIIDIATLTGASLIALGYIGTPFLTTNEKLREKIKNASEKSLEKVWEFPLWQEYEENIKSDVADLKHISEESDAGVIIGATFLKNFVNEIPWAHIDIGTTVWSKADKGVLTKGATGVTARLMMEMLREWK
ncbi:leucyl aminopeptidase [Candidatus Woesearchaeota archaeon]|nr:leucyl aminopeptidase [Candidatus Woesearchaeota archaeon]